MSDHFDRLSDEALLGYLRRPRLAEREAFRSRRSEIHAYMCQVSLVVLSNLSLNRDAVLQGHTARFACASSHSGEVAREQPHHYRSGIGGTHDIRSKILVGSANRAWRHWIEIEFDHPVNPWEHEGSGSIAWDANLDRVAPLGEEAVSIIKEAWERAQGDVHDQGLPVRTLVRTLASERLCCEWLAPSARSCA